MLKNKKHISLIILTFMFFNIFNNFLVFGEEKTDKNTIYINDALDLIKLSENCSLDSFSRGKTVILTQNIDLSEHKFEPIPTFGGTFEGSDFTIENLNLNQTGSNLGLFRYIQKSGTVKNLNLTGTIIPEGTKKNIGGIVGVNEGRILNCTFSGNIEAKNTVGGIAGINDANGYIGGSTSYGSLSGENYCGGVVGQNHGIIVKAINEMSVNTSSTEDSIKLEDMRLSNLTSSGNLGSSESTITHTDTGGVAGFSNGIIQSCENRGQIGYQHVGYNVGGIVGRQSGYVNGCKNFGEVLGRKDVSGIVGQMEPYLLIKFAEDTLQKLDKEFENLRNIVDKSADDVGNSSRTFSDNFSNLLDLTDKASDELHEVLNQTTDFADETVTNINEVSVRISKMLDKVEPALKEMGNATDQMSDAFDQFSEGFSELETTSTHMTNATKDISNAFDDLSSANKDIKEAFEMISNASILLQASTGNQSKSKEAVKDLEEALKQLETASNDVTDIVNTLADLFEQLNGLGGVDWDKLSNDLRTSADSLSRTLDDTLPKIREALTDLSNAIIDDVNAIKGAMIMLFTSFEYLDDAVTDIERANSDFKDAMKDFESAGESTEKAMDKFEKGSSTLSSASDSLTSSVNQLEEAIKEANEEPDIEFPLLGNKVTEPTDNFFKTLDDMSTHLNKMNEDSSNSSDTLVSDVKAINNQINKIIDIIMDEKKRALEEDPDFHEDISEKSSEYKDIDYENYNKKPSDVRQGYVTECFNIGNIEGDIDVGGIAGSMAIEYDFDPEDEIDVIGKNSLRFKYQTRAVLRNSKNQGSITSKKNYVGGISGKTDLGLIAGCENYGFIQSTDGDYVGGISGSSATTIKNSYSKCKLSGRDYIGGIAGFGTNIYDSHSIVNISEANESIGAIAGKSDGELKNNFFVKSKYDGIDNISYEGKAVPKEYNEFIQEKKLPSAFKDFALTFKADDKVLKTIYFKHGDSISLEDIPEIPEKEGHYSDWPEFDYNNLVFSHTLEAIYTPFHTTVSIDTPDNVKQSKLLIEGTFGPNTKVDLSNFDGGLPNLDQNQKVLNKHTANISISGYNDKLTFPIKVRYLEPQLNERTKVWVLDNQEWIKVNTKVEGSYLVFNTNALNTTFCVVDTNLDMYYRILYGSIIAAIVGFIIFIKVFKKRVKKRRLKKAK